MSSRIDEVTGERRRIYVGDDPGKEGWITWLDQDGKIVGQAPRPSIPGGKGDTFDELGYVRLVRRIEEDGLVVVWTIEKQEQAGIQNKRSTIVVQFEAYGCQRGVLAALGVPTLRVRAQTWRSGMSVERAKTTTRKNPPKTKSSKDEDEKAEKAHRKAKAEERKAFLANLIKAAQGLWPDMPLLVTPDCTTPSPDMAASRLIAEYGRRTSLGMLIREAENAKEKTT